MERIGNAADHLDYEHRADGTVEIVDIVVTSARRAGVGRALIAALFKRLPRVRVWAITRASNEIAQQFYEALGFETVGVLRRFYGGDGADAVMYGRWSDGPV